MPWQRHGRVFVPDGTGLEWMASHASNPFAERIEGDRFRVYFSCRDAASRSSVGWLEIDVSRPAEVLALAEQPVIGPGEPGAFDADGTSLGCIVPVGERRYLYYLGWNVEEPGRWRNTIGLAISEGGEEFVKRDEPVLGLSDADPHSLSYPWVLREIRTPEADRGGGAHWRMWYGSTASWSDDDHVVHPITTADGGDGVRWRPSGSPCIEGEAGALGLSRPCVLAADGRYRMWFSYRGARYRIGYAESDDGLRWRRRGAFGFEPSGAENGDGWDAEAVAYPHVFLHRGRLHMLYCGNDYGKTGFGLAVWDD